MGSRSRRKGHAYEREVANELSVVTGRRHERVLTETRDGNVGDVKGDTPLVIQCKVGKSPPIWPAIQQAEDAARGTGRHPVAYVKRNGAGARAADEIVVLRREDWAEIVGLLVHRGIW